jgi:hypothetical protein
MAYRAIDEAAISKGLSPKFGLGSLPMECNWNSLFLEDMMSL